MASVFSPSEFNIGFEQPVVDRSSSVFSDIGSSLLKGFDTAATASIREAKANKTTYSQAKDENEKLMLAKYSTGLGDIWNDPDYSEAQKRLLTNTFKLSFFKSGVDASGDEFQQVDQLITGETGENLQFSDNELIIEDLKKTPEGQAEIMLARFELDASNVIQSTDSIVGVLRRKEAIALQYDNIVVDNDVDFINAEPLFRQKLTDFMANTKYQVEALEKEGVVITEQMLAGAYSQFVSIKLDLLSKIPGTVTSAKRSGIDSLLETTDELFKGLGLKEENGAIVFNRDQSVYDLQGKAKAIIAALEMENTAPSNLLALQISQSNFQLDPVTFANLTTKMQDLQIIDLQPKAFVEAELIVSDSLTKTFNNVRDFLNPYDPLADPSVSEIRIDQLDKEKALSLLPEDKQAQWKALDNTQAWKLFNFLATSSKGFNSNNIREDKDGKLTQGLYTNLIGLSLAFETVDFKTDPSSTLGIKEGINANLPRLLNILESVDPIKGESARSMLFRSLATSKVQYDARIATQQNQTPIIFNKQTGSFELDENKMVGNSKENRIVKSIVRDYYGGDLIAALKDSFRDAMAKKEYRNLFMGGQSRAMQITNTNFKSVSELADLMATSTYLTKFADSISPESYKSFFADAERMDKINSVEAPTVSSDTTGAEVINDAEVSTIEPAPKDNPISVSRWFINSAVMKNGTKIIDLIKEEQKNLATPDEIKELILEEISNNKDFYKKAIQAYLKSEEVPVGSWYKNLDGTLFQLK